MDLKKEFRFTSVSGHVPPRPASNQLGALAALAGVWKGHGFNQIWRPFHDTSQPEAGKPKQDRFLELNQTIGTLEIAAVPGNIPSRAGGPHSEWPPKWSRPPKKPKHTVRGAILSAGLCAVALASGCENHLPHYTIIRTPSLQLRLDACSSAIAGVHLTKQDQRFRSVLRMWESRSCGRRKRLARRMRKWADDYEKALRETAPWVPKEATFFNRFSKIRKAYDIPAKTGRAIQFETLRFLFRKSAGMFSAGRGCGGALAYLNRRAATMLDLADRENAGIFASTPADTLCIANHVHKLRRWDRRASLGAKKLVLGIFHPTRIGEPPFPVLMGLTKPVGVSIVANWRASQGPTKRPRAISPAFTISPAVGGKGKPWLVTFRPGPSPGMAGGKSTRYTNAWKYHAQQKVTLDISTMLNSPFALDRVDYVCNYILVYRWPLDASSLISLRSNFWKHLFTLYSRKAKDIGAEAWRLRLDNDLRRTLQDTAVRITSASPSTTLRRIDLGTWSQRVGSTTKANATAKVGGISPGVSYSHNYRIKDSQHNTRQIDRLSAYISPQGNFLRVGQRGGQSLDLSGRLKVRLGIRVPAAHHKIWALVPEGKTGRARFTRIRLPLYNEVDAVTFSVAVAREPTTVVPSSAITSGLTDTKSARLVAYVTRPACIPIWRNERHAEIVTVRDVWGAQAADTVLYFEMPEGRAHRIIAMGFNNVQEQELFAEVRSARHTKKGPIELSMQPNKSSGLPQFYVKIGLKPNAGSNRLLPIVLPKIKPPTRVVR